MRHAGPTYGLEVQGAIKETISELSSNRSSVIENRLFGFIRPSKGIFDVPLQPTCRLFGKGLKSLYIQISLSY